MCASPLPCHRYVAEYVSNQPRCGTVMSLEDGDLEPLRGQLRDMALTAKLDLAATGQGIGRQSAPQSKRSLLGQWGCRLAALPIAPEPVEARS